MTGVSAILQQLAANAAATQLARGNRYADLIQGISNVPAQILNDQERQQQIDLQRAGEAQRLAIANRADARAQADQAYQDRTRANSLATDHAISVGLAAAMGPDQDPNAFDAKAAYQAVSALGRPEVLPAIIAKHREMQGTPLFKKADEIGINRDTMQPIPGLGATDKMPEPGTPAYAIATQIKDLEGAPGAPAPAGAAPAPGVPILPPPPLVLPPAPGGPGAPATTAAPPLAGGPGVSGVSDVGPAVPGATPPPVRLTHAQAVAKAYADAEAAKDPIVQAYAKRASGAPLSPADAALIDGYEAKAAVTEAPVTVKTVVGGQMVEKVMTRKQALAAGWFPSQPPASVQVQNMPAAPVLPPSKAEIAIANYMLPPPSPRTFTTPSGRAMLDRILTANPDYDQGLYATRAPTRKAYTTGTQGQQIVAINTAIQHLDLLQQAADALNNGTFKPGNAVYNALSDVFGKGAPTSFDTIKEKVDKELDAVASKGVPTISGAAAQKAIGGRAASPEAIKSYIDSSTELLGGSYNALRLPYQQAMGAQAPFDFLTPQAKAILTKRGFDPDSPAADFGDSARTGGSSTAGARGATPAGGLITVTDPKGGVHTFLTPADAAAFKRAAGIP